MTIKQSLSALGLQVPVGDQDTWKSTCPKCSGSRTKSYELCVSVDGVQGLYNCHHCEFQGSVMKKNGAPAPPKPEVMPWEKKSLHQTALDWFETRGISRETLESENIYSEKRKLAGKMSQCIVFPYFDRDGNIINEKWRDRDKNFSQKRGGGGIPYRWEKFMASEYKSIIITEGEMDALSFVQAGYDNVISVPNGAPSPNSKNLNNHMRWINDEFLEKLADVEEIYLAVDNDAPGQQLEKEIARRLEFSRCKKVEYPENCKDANDVITQMGVNALKSALYGSFDYPVEGEYRLSGIKPFIDRIYDHGHEKGVSTGFMNLDEYWTVRPQEMTVLTGIPGHGKSEFLDQLIINLINKEKWAFSIFSPENFPPERHAIKWIEKKVGKSFDKNTDGRMLEHEKDKAIKDLDPYIYGINPPDDGWNLGAILDMMKFQVQRYGVRGCVIDPWNMLDHFRTNDSMNETEYISQSLSEIKRFCQTYKVHFWIVAHPRKIELLDGKERMPTAYDIAGSAHWYNKSDNIMIVHRDDKSKHEFTLHLHKVRFKEVGRTGECDFEWEKGSGRVYTSDF